MNVQLEQAVSRLREKSQAIAEMKIAAQRAEQNAERLEKALKRAQGDLLTREQEISELKMKVGRLPSGSEEVSNLVFCGLYIVRLLCVSCWLLGKSVSD